MTYLKQTKDEVISYYQGLGIEPSKINYSDYPICRWSFDTGKLVDVEGDTEGNMTSVQLISHGGAMSAETVGEINRSKGIIVTGRSQITGHVRWSYIPVIKEGEETVRATTCVLEVRQWEPGRFKLCITPELTDGTDTTEIEITEKTARGLEYLNNSKYKG